LKFEKLKFGQGLQKQATHGGKLVDLLLYINGPYGSL
jgi:hypothetical protein